MSARDLGARWLAAVGTTGVLDRLLGPDRLTVLAYHRIANWEAPGFADYAPLASATPAAFAAQLDVVADAFSVIGLEQLGAFLERGQALPPRPLLITFDDGYADNYHEAWPALRRHGFPAVVFLLTGGLDTGLPPWWDWCAQAFRATARQRATLPLIGDVSLAAQDERGAVCEQVIHRLKAVAELDKVDALREIAAALDVAPPQPQRGRFLDWDQVREMSASGISFQPHTVTHPLLTRVGRDEARREIAESQRRITEETGTTPWAFAYPNGQVGDYDGATLEILRSLGCRAAFTLAPGPASFATVRCHPLEIPRTYVGRRDTLDVFALKLAGAAGLLTQRRFVG